MTLGSLFAGIGGLDIGLERAGFTVKWQVEQDEFASAVLARHWPNAARFRDVRECGAENLERVDCIAGGFPCQPHSRAGARRGRHDHRNLWPDFERIVRALGPRWVIAENVPDIRTTMADEVLGGLEAMGYTCRAVVVGAWAVGAPMLRERSFFIAHSEREGASRLEPLRGPGVTGPWGWRGEEDLEAIAAAPFERGDRWPEPLLRRVDDGVPARVDRLRALGNAVVPQVAEVIGRAVIAAEAAADG